ncbi:MAG: hypothetical protein FWG33_04270, partial [Oscillospiraceae bacterium]|nr:hypothetical protein [Oscillospiraceae bacterium]
EIARNINERDYHRIKASDVGVFKLGDFDYHIYAQILKHFDIESRDWKNPGQAFDEKLITVVEQQAAEEARMKREAKIAD